MAQFKHTFFYLAILISNYYTQAQTIPLNNIVSLTNILSESSGITYIAPNRLYTHNDSGGNDEIFEIDTLGNLIRIININNANNNDWEDITHDSLNNIYIGDFGNNNNDRTNLRIYKITNPANVIGNNITATVIQFTFPDQIQFPPPPAKRNFDAEAFIWFNDSLFIFTKNRTAPFNGYCKMYKIPASPGTYTAELCDSILLCNSSQNDCWVTSAAISNDNSHLALLNDNKIWWFSCFNGSAFFKGAMAAVALNSNTQKEGITFKNNSKVYITDEYSTVNNNGGNLYQANLSNYLAQPYVNFINDSIICDNCTLTVDSFVGAISWSNGLFGPSIQPDYTGWHYASAKNLNNCIVVDSIYVSYLQTVKEINQNPIQFTLSEASVQGIHGLINLNAASNCTLQLLDITGKIIATQAFSISTKQQHFYIPLQVASGLYILNIRSNNGNYTYKIAIAE